MPDHSRPSLIEIPIAIILGWVLPGLGHIFIRQRTRGLIFLVAITATFWTGVAVGGIQGTVNPDERKLWFVAQMGTGGNALLAWVGHEATSKPINPKSSAPDSAPLAHWRSLDVAIHYTGVAGLLNVLVLLDVVARAEARRRSHNPLPTAKGGSP